ncbi:MAG: hypothetical protein ABIM89_10835 [Mycobacteriales bacterium]
MQNRYAGDLGDFFKIALLRLLAKGDPTPLGLVWCLAPDESHNLDGKHITYLQPEHAIGQRLRALDPQLYDLLATMLRERNRSVRSIEDAGVLPDGTVSFTEPLALPEWGGCTARERLAHRENWLRRALAATKDCGVVCFDPDNGIRSPTHAVKMHRTSAVKHLYTSELVPFVSRGQSCVVYHHADRSAAVAAQAQSRLQLLEEEVGGEAVCAVHARRGSARLFLVLAAMSHVDDLTHRLRELDASPWRGDLDVIWRQR